MKILEDIVKIEKFTSKIFDTYFKDLSFSLFDIETMGLTKNNEINLATIGTYIDNEFILKQYFIESLEEEPLLINEIITELKKYDFTITYNGRLFDIPFVNKRAKILNLKELNLEDEIEIYNFDLYQILRHYSELNNILPDIRQKTIEEFLGLKYKRLDKIIGKDSIELYNEFLNTNDLNHKKELENTILLHNHDDVLMLYRILDVIRNVDLNKALSKQGFIIKGKNNWKNILINKIEIKNNTLNCNGKHFEDSLSYLQFDPFYLSLKKDGTFEINVPLEKIKNGLVINLKEMDLDNDNLKSLGNYVNSYLILKNKEFNYLEINLLVREILNETMKKISR